jgi:hypothetical protein
LIISIQLASQSPTRRSQCKSEKGSQEYVNILHPHVAKEDLAVSLFTAFPRVNILNNIMSTLNSGDMNIGE